MNILGQTKQILMGNIFYLWKKRSMNKEKSKQTIG